MRSGGGMGEHMAVRSEELDGVWQIGREAFCQDLHPDPIFLTPFSGDGCENLVENSVSICERWSI